MLKKKGGGGNIGPGPQVPGGLILYIVYYFWINTFFEEPYYNDIKII
jgi:hypothetical protein